MYKKSIFLFFTFLIAVASCNRAPSTSNKRISDLAANDEIAVYLESFKGLGALTDSTLPTPPQEALKSFRVSDDLSLDLVLSEPQVVQPLELSFDHRGRLWLVQYHQYPYPNGVKITGVDNFLRMQFDRVPLAPPQGVKGADKITVFEDTDGAGDRSGY